MPTHAVHHVPPSAWLGIVFILPLALASFFIFWCIKRVGTWHAHALQRDYAGLESDYAGDEEDAVDEKAKRDKELDRR